MHKFHGMLNKDRQVSDPNLWFWSDRKTYANNLKLSARFSQWDTTANSMSSRWPTHVTGGLGHTDHSHNTCRRCTWWQNQNRWLVVPSWHQWNSFWWPLSLKPLSINNVDLAGI